jgi:hypothetical protein
MIERAALCPRRHASGSGVCHCDIKEKTKHYFMNDLSWGSQSPMYPNKLHVEYSPLRIPNQTLTKEYEFVNDDNYRQIAQNNT